MYKPDQPLCTATTQDLWTALLLKRHFNSFEPEPIVQALYAQPQLWRKFWLGWLVFDLEFYQKTGEAPIARLLEMLVYAQDERLCRNDVLYIQSADDACVPDLLDLAKQWHADDCEVYDRTRLAKLLGNLTTLIEVLGEEAMAPQLEEWKERAICTPIIAMWWD
ncbi:hypothetical protein [Stenomitos frigidus]|nr:hypothetical protein [Stenomitos frigidus]